MQLKTGNTSGRGRKEAWREDFIREGLPGSTLLSLEDCLADDLWSCVLAPQVPVLQTHAGGRVYWPWLRSAAD